MAFYKYRAARPGAPPQEIVIEADSEADSLSRLRRRGMTPVKSFGEVGTAAPGSGLRFLSRGGFNVYDFTNRLVPLLEANIQLERALAIIEEGMNEKNGLEVVRTLRRGLHEGKRFSELIRAQGNRFPGVYASLIETGEETGCLPEVAKELQRFLNESRELREFIITSSIYPVIVISVTMIVVVLLFTVFIPRFSKIFEEMGRKLPLITQVMLDIGNVMSSLWWIWPLIIAGIIFFFRQVGKGGALKQLHDEWLLRIPLLGGIVRDIQISRFVRTLAIMIKNHVHLLPAIKISGKVILNRTIEGSLSGVEADLRGGAKLSAALSQSAYMPPGSSAMLRIAEESGDVGEMLERVAEESERSVRVKIKRLLALMEPFVIVFLALIVMLVVLSIFLAIMEMNAI